MPPKGQTFERPGTSVNICPGVWSDIVHSKIWGSPYYQNIYCLLCCLNFMLLMIIMATPIWFQQYFKEEYIAVGIWSFCDHSVCKDLTLSEEAHLDTIRLFSILSFIFTLVAFISSRNFISHLMDKNIIEDLISSVSNFCAGIFLMSLLLIVHFRLKPVLDENGSRTTPWWGFIGSCLICVHCFVLGTLSFLRYKSLALKRLRRDSSGKILSMDRILTSRRIIYHLFCFLNFMIVLIVILTPFWLWNNFNNEFIFMGLWLKCDNSGCHKMSLPDVSPVMLQTARWFSLLAFISSLISLILSQDNLTQFLHLAFSKSLISSMANFFAGIFLLLALMITCFGITGEINTEEKYLTVSFGFYVGCVACLLAFLLGIVSLMNPGGLFESSKKQKPKRRLVIPEDYVDYYMHSSL